MISVILITYNEEKEIENVIANLLQLRHHHGFEIIVSDGGSTDRTLAKIPRNLKVLVGPLGKAKQINRAIKQAVGDIIFIVHADMLLAEDTLISIEKSVYDEGFDAGGFANEFDQFNNRIKRLGRLMNIRLFNRHEQSDKGVFYGDNGLFIKRQVLETVGGIPDLAIMEDYALSVKLGGKYRLKKICSPSITVSARRHIQDGFIMTRLRWIVIRKLYQWGVPPSLLAKCYKHTR